MSKQGGVRFQWYHGALILLLLILAGVIVVNVDIPGIGPGEGQEPTVIYTAPDGTQFKCPPQSYNDYLAYMYENFPGQAPEPLTPPVTETHPAAQVQFQVRDFITKAAVTTATTTADFCRADSSAVFDFLAQEDTLTVSSTPDQGAVFFGDGDQVIIVVDCTGNPTGGLDYYDGWFYCVLHEGNPIYYLTADMLQVVSTDPYTYKVNAAGAEETGYLVTFTSGTTNYWDIGQLYLYPRSSADNFDISFTYRSVTLASVTAGGTASNFVDADAEITANATLESTDETAYFEVYVGANNIGWGWDQFILTKDGELKVYKPVIIMSTAMTAIGTSELQNKGWVAINDNTLTAEKAFYKVLDAHFPTKGSKVDFKVEIPIDSSAASSSTEYLFKLWCIDINLPSNIAIGSCSSSVPSVWGFLTAYGPGDTIQSRAYSTSAGAGTNEILRAYFTTP